MATAQALNTAQTIYIAFYQRPADPAGLRFWADQIDLAGGNLSNVINAFANSAEATTLYGPINATTITSVVNGIYQAAFGRAPQAINPPINTKYGLIANEAEFYTKGFAAGDFTPGTIALAVLQGAQGSDAGAVLNKVQVANAFTVAVDGRALTDATFGQGTSFAATYNGADISAARTFLAGVTANPSSVPSNAQIGNFVSTSIANPGDPAADKTVPTITAQAGIKQYAENQAATAVLETVTATDNVGVTGFSIVSGNDAGLFQINSKGEISFTAAGASKTAASNDFETAPNDFVLGVVALDAAGNKSATSNFSLRVTDVDDRAPVITGSVVNGTRVTLSYDESLNAARQPAIGDYAVAIAAGGSIAVTSVQVTGNTVVLTLGRAPNPGEVLNVSYTPGTTAVADAAGNGVAAIAARPLVVDTTAPVIAAGQTITYAEDKVTGVTATRTTDTVVGKITATDDTGVVSYNITAGNAAGFFAIDSSGNIRLTAAGIAGAANDFETLPNSFNLTVTATDGAGNISAAQAVTISVTNVAADDVVAPPSVQTIQFTSGNDNVTPNGTVATSKTSAGDDTGAAFFDGAAQGSAGSGSTIGLGDTVDFAGGTADKLILTISKGAAAPNNNPFNSAVSPVLNGVEIIDVRSTGANANLISLANGIAPVLTTLNVDASNQALTITDIAATVNTFGLTNTAGDPTFASTFTAVAGSRAGATDAVTLNLVNNGGGKNSTLNFNSTAVGEAIEIINLNATGGASTIKALTSSNNAAASSLNTKLATLNITGSSNLTITNELEFSTAGNNKGVVNATDFSGNLSLKFGTTAGDADNLTVTGGSGNDRLNFGNALDLNDSINGGAGTDTILISQDFNAGAAAGLKQGVNQSVSIEVLEFTQALAQVDASLLTNIKALSFSGGGNIAVNGVVNANTIEFTAAAAATSVAAGTGGTVANVSLNANLVSGAGTGDGFTINSLNTSTFATTNLTSTAVTGTNQVTTLTVAANGTLNISGAAAFTTTIAGTDAVINASAATGKLTLTGEAGNNKITGGTANDTIDGAGGNDTIDGGGGADRLNGGAGADSITGGAGNDEFVVIAPAETRGATFAVTDTNANNIDRFADFNGNGALVGDSFRVTAGNFGSANTATASVTAFTVANANNFVDLQGALAGIQLSSANVFSVADVTVSQGSLQGRYLIINDATAGYTAGTDAIIQLVGGAPALVAQDFTLV